VKASYALRQDVKKDTKTARISCSDIKIPKYRNKKIKNIHY
jgi:hypothetical protein